MIRSSHPAFVVFLAQVGLPDVHYSLDLRVLFGARLLPRPALAVSPLFRSFFAGLFAEEDSWSMLDVVSPEAFISVSVRPSLGAFAFHASVNELSLVLGAVWPQHHSEALNRILFELTVVYFAGLSEVVLSLTLELSRDEFALVVVTIELKPSFSSFLSLDKIPLVSDGSEVPSLGSPSVVHVVLPFARIHGAVLVDVHSESVCFALAPLALVDISVGMSHASLAVEQTVFRLALVFASVREDDGAKSFEVAILVPKIIKISWLKICHVAVDLPLTLVLLVLADVDEEVVPVEVFALGLPTQLQEQFFVCQQRLVRVN